MFQFRRFPSCTYLIQCRIPFGGFPHSEISGSMLICSSPKLIAACHVFHRLLMPRHSPCTLYSLTFCLVTFWFSNKKFLELCRLLRGINCSLFYPSFTEKFPQIKMFYLSVACLILLISWSRIVQFSRCNFQFLFRNQISTLSTLNAEIQPLNWWWAQVDSNHRPRAYQARALTCWAMSPSSKNGGYIGFWWR